MMRKSQVRMGLMAIAIAATTSAFTTKSSFDPDDHLWFDPSLYFNFQFFGTPDEALDHFSGSLLPYGYVVSVGYSFDRYTNPPMSNPFDHIEYAWGEPDDGSTLKLNEYGEPLLTEDLDMYE